MVLEEITQSHEGPDFLDVAGWPGILDRFQLGLPRFDALWVKVNPR